MSLSSKAFQKLVYDYYDVYGRHDMPWRQPETDGTFNPYSILVSEIMLQQTQVSRVIPKYEAFLQKFPTVMDLASAELRDVLQVWSGLGYNRRAKFLHTIAQTITSEFNGRFPHTPAELVMLPGVGVNTAGAIMAYAYNEPVIFVETNIRTVYIHHFFSDEVPVADTAIRQRLEATIDRANPRGWYWALMDYGAHLKLSVGNLNQRSAIYAKQSKFAGSRRQIRGQVIRTLTKQDCSLKQLTNEIQDTRLKEVLYELLEEKLISKHGQTYHL